MGQYEFAIVVALESKEALTNMLSEMGCLGSFEMGRRVIAYFPDTSDVAKLRHGLRCFRSILRESGLNHELSFDAVLLPDRDWNESWKRKFQPIDVGEKLTLLPPWEKTNSDGINLVVDPGMAFGTGHHETTRRCLMLIEKFSGAKTLQHGRLPSRCAASQRAIPPFQTKEGLPRGGSFLDIGTGTGVLAVAAARLGYQEVVGLDTDPLALDAAKRNMKLNGIGTAEIRAGTISDVHGSFDLIAANLMSEVLIRIASDITHRLKPSGVAILSGMLVGQDIDVIRAMEAAELAVREHVVDNRWVSLVVGHRGC